MKIGFFEFLVFLAYYVIAKVLFQLVNIEARRTGLTIPAGVAGLLA